MGLVRGRVLLVVFLWGCAPAVEPPYGLLDGGCFTVFPEELDFGEVPSFTSATQKLLLTNHTEEVLLLRADLLPPPFFALGDGNPSVGPGGTGAFDVRFAPLDGRLHLSEIEVRGSDRCRQRIPMRGLGSGRLELDPPQLSFGGVDLGDTKVLELKLTNTRRIPITLEDVRIINDTSLRPGFSSPFTTDAPSRIELGPLASTTIRVTAAPGYGAPFNARLLGTSERDVLRLPMTLLGGTPVAELAQTDLEVPLVEFTPGAANPSFIERHLLVRNVGVDGGALPLRFLAPQLRVQREDGGVADGEFQLSAPSGINGGSQALVTLRYEPSEFGVQLFRLVLNTNEVNQPERVLRFIATAVTLPPCDLAYPREVPFVSTSDGGSEGLVVFRNRGGTRCVIDDVYLRDADFSSFRLLDGGVVQVELAPGEEHVVSLAGPGPSSTSSPTAELNFHRLSANSQNQFVVLFLP